MSTVITSDRVVALVAALVQNSQLFWGMLKEWRIQGTVPGVFDFELNWQDEEIAMFWSWMTSDKAVWPGFDRQWKLHLILKDPDGSRNSLKEDWPPPRQWARQFAQGYALPQYPQQRVRIADPTDVHGRKRSIRVHFAEDNGRKIVKGGRR